MQSKAKYLLAASMLATLTVNAQTTKRVVKAKAANKYVVCQVGGNWCPWCLRFADFVEKDSVVNKTVNDNFEFIPLP